MVDPVHYAKSDGAHVAYQVVGQGPRDLIVLMDGFISVDTMDDEPRLARCMRRLNTFARLIRFDRRGVGLSDPSPSHAPPTLEQWVDDAIAVLDAVGSERAVILASAEMSPVGLLLAASHPQRIASLVLVNAYARAVIDIDYPDGLPAEVVAQRLADCTALTPAEGVEDFVFLVAPSAAHDPEFQRWWNETGRRGASPATARALMQVEMQSDVRAVLPTIQSPTIVIHLRENPLVPVAIGRYIADHLPGARWVEVPGADDLWWVSDSAEAVLDEIEEFVTGHRSLPPSDRVLATVLFTDVVASTRQALALGDRRWTEMLDRHDAVIRHQLERFRGTEVNTTGDGFVATFDGPARAIGCACAIRDAARQLGIEVRSGVHTGEIQLRDDDIGGIGVHIAARVAARAEPSTVWVSRTVTDLVMGAGISFTDMGQHELKGIPGSWTLYSVAG